MTLILNERYPGRYNNPSAEYPQGSFKNRTTPTAKDGSYLEEDWANDKLAFYSSLLEEAGIDANGQVDKVGDCQTFDALLQVIANATVSAPYAPGYFSGFIMANNPANPNTVVDVGSGAARSSNGLVNIQTTSTISGIIQLSGSWAPGNNQNKLDSGTRASNTWYHTFAIRKTLDGSGDILFSTSATSPTIPSGYAGFRRIGAVRTDASGNILAFLNFGDVFYLSSPIREAAVSGATNPTTTTATITTPSGVTVEAIMDLMVKGEGVTGYLRSPNQAAITVGVVQGTYLGGAHINTDGAAETNASEVSVFTNNNSQIVIQVASVTGTIIYTLVTRGWREVSR